MKSLHLLCAMLLTGDVAGHSMAASPASADLQFELPANLEGKLPANLLPTFPKTGVDHIVTYGSWRGWGPPGGDRVVIFRHGALIRTETSYIGSKRAGEDANATEFSNLDTAAWVNVVPDGEGALDRISLGRGGFDDVSIHRYTLAATDMSETIAGEHCSVRLAKRETNEGPYYSACITRDGVMLRETVLYGDGKVMNEKRAIKVERRPVRLDEVLPPAGALNWPFWTAKAAVRPADNGNAGDYELRLAGTLDGKPAVKLMRKAGEWKSEEDQIGLTVRELRLFNSAMILSYYNRNAPGLSIGRQDKVSLGGFQSAPLSEPPASIVGERCTWYNAAVGVSDYGRIECRTHDQLPLIRREYSRGSRQTEWLAVGLDRAPASSGSITPPAQILDWAFWGWPQLAKHR